MKKLLFVLSVVVLLAAGCNSSQQANVAQNVATATPTPQQQIAQSATPSPIQNPNNDAQNWKTYSSTSLGFSIQYPSTWSIDSQRSSTNEVVLNNGGVESHISISAQPYSKTLTDWKNSLDQTVITQTKTISIGGQSGIEVYSGEMGGLAGQIGVVYNGHLYILNEADSMPVTMLTSFKFTAQQSTTDTDLTVADNVVVNFMSDMKGSDYNAAYNKLSASGQNFVNQEPQTYSQNDRLMYGLYGFIGKPALPDNGVSVTNTVKVNNTTIKVTTVWKYTKSTSTVAFTLKLENGQWKIDKVQ
ncbi:MAG: PsbP-related protein [Legionella sp.]|uniref:PsbP-related protein n=1 Tax=Legionella sp. TaxID=459 RepID=UPI00284B5F3A|nr:PsbP-related protein [Legionella sp.]